jgi:DNA-binding PadR family transcriptional regulator
MYTNDDDVQNDTESAKNNLATGADKSETTHRACADGSATWSDLTGFQRDALEAIAAIELDGEDPYGLAIKDDLNEDYSTEINHGRLYPNLDTLADYGFVDKSQLDRRTNEYSLTDAGRRMFENRTLRMAESLDLSVESSSQATVTDGGHDDQ